MNLFIYFRNTMSTSRVLSRLHNGTVRIQYSVELKKSDNSRDNSQNVLAVSVHQLLLNIKIIT